MTHNIDYHAGALREEAQDLACAEQNFAEMTREFADRYGARLRLAWEVLEYIEEMGNDPYNEVQAYGGFELTWDRVTQQVSGIWFYSDVDVCESYLGGDHRHEHGMSFDDFCDNWRSWYAEKDHKRAIIQERIEKGKREAAENAQRRVEEEERAEYERLREKFGIGE